MDDYLKEAASGFYEVPKKRIKEIREMEQNKKRYIELFDFGGARKLPIKRIIVGPHPNKLGNMKKLRRLVGPSIRVDISDTPYIG